MAKVVHDDVLDGALQVLVDNAAKMAVCAGQPADVAACEGGLAIVAMSTGDFTIGNGSTSGRKVAVAEKATVAVAATGVADHVALYSTATNKVYFITTCSSQALTSTANSVTIPTWAIEIADPT